MIKTETKKQKCKSQPCLCLPQNSNCHQQKPLCAVFASRHRSHKYQVHAQKLRHTPRSRASPIITRKAFCPQRYLNTARLPQESGVRLTVFIRTGQAVHLLRSKTKKEWGAERGPGQVPVRSSHAGSPAFIIDI